MTGGTGTQSEANGETAAGGRYLVERLLGQGGMASVYKVLDRASGQRIALKRLHTQAPPAAAGLFEREYRTLASLRHPCIVEAYDYGVDADGPYYTMELVDGHDLSGSAPVPWRTACAYLRDAASIVGLLHARSLLHRDLSPHNLMDSGGRLKLIDFGALSDFGRPGEVAGTPPFVPPEAVHGEPLDQRADLFALGALGYWLVTGRHAYPARQLSQLEALWAHEPPPTADVIARLDRAELAPPPPEFDELLGLLLSIERDARIASTAELIDRLNVLAELEPEAAELAVLGYLGSSAFAGREPERQQVALAIAAARAGVGQVLVVEGPPGVGRSRFLHEVGVNAKLEGGTAIAGGTRAGKRAYGLAAHLLSQLAHALPDETRAAIGVHHAALAPVMSLADPTAEPRSTIQAAGDERARLQNALLDAFCDVARRQPLSLLVDDLEKADEESLALITALAHLASQLRLCLIVGLTTPASASPPAAITSLRTTAEVITLAPLSTEETRILLRSVFGEVPYLDRLAERLHRAAEGNPAHCLELAQHLVRTGEARYVEGSWNLPGELRLDALPPSRPAGLLLRLERLPKEARALAQAMSVPHASIWTAQLAADAAATPLSEVQRRLPTLVRERVLKRAEGGYVFSHDLLARHLQAELQPERQRAIHRQLGQGLCDRSRPDDIADRLAACVHFLCAGELQNAYPLLIRALSQSVNGDPAQIGLHAPAYEQIYRHLREAGQDDHALSGPLAMLAVSGYFADRRYALTYGPDAVATLERVLKLDRARRLARVVGRKPALLIALSAAAVDCFRSRARGMSVDCNVRGLLLAASTLAGTAAICMDPDRAARYARYLEPFTAFGPNHAATVVHDFTALMSLQGRDRPAACVAAYEQMLRRLESPEPIKDMTDIVRASYYAGVHLTLGVFLVRRDDREGLALADKLEQFSPLYAMGADHLRANYYAGQGELEQAHYWRQRMEVHAIQHGTAWQVETWAPVDVINIAMRLHDAAALKRAADELAHVCAKVPSLSIQERYARIGYLVLSGQYQEALALGDACHEAPYSHNGWMRNQGTLARACNALGLHERARKLCEDAMAGADPAELQYVIMNLGISIELAMAEAGLGLHAQAHQRLQRLLETHAPNDSPITLGALHEARARVSVSEGALVSAREHLSLAESHIEPLGIASLTRRLRALSREIGRADAGRSLIPSTAPPPPRSEIFSRAQALLRERGLGADWVRDSLDALLELCSASEAHLWLRGEGDPGTHTLHAHDTMPPSVVVAWVEEQLRALTVADDDTVLTRASERGPSPEKVVGPLRYRSRALWSRNADDTSPFAILVLAFPSQSIDAPKPEVLRAFVSHLLTRSGA